MSKARILADLISDSQITASEITGLELNAIQEGDTIVEVSDDGSGGKVVVRVDGADNAEFNAGGMVIPSGTTAQRDPNAALGSLRYNTTIGFFETLTGSGWGAVATPPSITGITPDNFNGEAGGTFTVDGAFFDADTIAVFKGADGTEYAAATVTFVNNSQITVTNATNLPVANEPFKVKVTNGAGLSVESTSTIDAGTVPAFTTAAGSLASTSRWDEAVSVTVNATDAENTITGYSVTEGNLPAGLSLNATTGAITGTSTEQATTTYTFTIGATDSAGNTNTRQFNIQIVNAAPVWNSPSEGSTQGLTQNTAGSITLDATDPEGGSVSYTSTNLPAGLNISGNLITGTPSVAANTSVAVNASDGFASSVRNFFINVQITYPLTSRITSFSDLGSTPLGSGNTEAITWDPINEVFYIASLQGGWKIIKRSGGYTELSQFSPSPNRGEIEGIGYDPVDDVLLVTWQSSTVDAYSGSGTYKFTLFFSGGSFNEVGFDHTFRNWHMRNRSSSTMMYVDAASVADVNAWQVGGTLSAPDAVAGDFGPDGNFYIQNHGNATNYVYDPRTQTQLSNVPVPSTDGSIRGMAFLWNDREMVSAGDGGTVYKYTF